MKCHGETLAGTDSAVSLSGNDFLVNWDGLTLDQLYDKMLTTMPSDNPKSLPSSKIDRHPGVRAVEERVPVGQGGAAGRRGGAQGHQVREEQAVGLRRHPEGTDKD